MDAHWIKGKLPTQVQINGKEEFFQSVVLLLLIQRDGEYHIVFEKRAANISQAGEISLPGGRIDDTDSGAEHTAIRETTEELGIPAERIEIIGRLDTVVAPIGAMIDVCVGISDIAFEDLKPNQDEVQRVFSIPLSYFQTNQPEEYGVLIKVHPTFIDPQTNEEVILFPSTKLDIPPKYHKPWGNLKNKVYVYKTEGEVIWGITARIVKDFVEKMKN